MDNNIVLYNLIEFIKSEDYHKKGDLINFIICEQFKQVKQQEVEREIYFKLRMKDLEGNENNEFR